MCKVELEVDHATGSTFLLEVDQPTIGEIDRDRPSRS